MATMVLLIRHAHHHLVNLAQAGRAPGIALSSTGVRQAWRLAERLAHERIACVQSSPQLRARQTAQSIGNALELPVEIAADVDEIDVGSWTGRPFAELEADPEWRYWNTRRSSACTPGGESMQDVRRRMVRHLSILSIARPMQALAIVTHAEPIRAAILHYRGMSLDDFAQIAIDPASVTRILIHERGGEIVNENDKLEALELA